MKAENAPNQETNLAGAKSGGIFRYSRFSHNVLIIFTIFQKLKKWLSFVFYLSKSPPKVICFI